MTSEIQQAFAHPSARSEASAGSVHRDRISLRDFVTNVEIGAFQAERGVTQRIRFNIVVEVTTTGADAADDVDKILSYDRLTEAISAELVAERLNLLETLAERVADRILGEPQAMRVFVRIEKLDRGPGALGVEIVRARDGKSTAPNAELSAAPRPRVAVLSPEALASSALSGALDCAVARGVPLLLCVAPGALPRPEADHPMAQRRIDLLALDQQAWLLAGRDKRCVVVATRTELEWALEHQPLAVWAPSKMVLDALDGPDGADFAALVGWFAAQMEAREILSLGAGQIESDIPCRVFAAGALPEALA